MNTKNYKKIQSELSSMYDIEKIDLLDFKLVDKKNTREF